MDRGRGIPEGQGSYDGLLAKGGQWNGNIKVVEHVIEQPLRWKRPRKIFVNSMSDLFHENVQDEMIDRIFDVMARASQHTFQILTKRPARMRDYLDGSSLALDSKGQQLFIASDGSSHAWPLPNVWIGVSIEDQASADERVPLLLDTPARETPGTPHKPVITTGFLLAAWVLRKPV
jgi:protein gp37